MDPCFLVVVVVDCNDNKNFLLEVNPSKNLRILRKEEQDEEQETRHLTTDFSFCNTSEIKAANVFSFCNNPKIKLY
jgi:hypothetical protein